MPVERQAPARSRAGFIEQGDSHVVLDRSKFVDKSGAWDKEALLGARQAYPDKELVFKDKSGVGVYLDRGSFSTPGSGALTEEGRKRYTALPKVGALAGSKLTGFYDMPAHSAKENFFAAEPKAVPLAQRPGVEKIKVVKVVSPEETERAKKRAEKASAAETRLKEISHHEQSKRAIAKLEASGIGSNLKKDLTLKKRVVARPKAAKEAAAKKAGKVRVPHPKRGEIWDGKKALGKNQYISSSRMVYYESRARMQTRGVISKPKARPFTAKALMAEARGNIRAIKRYGTHRREETRRARKFESYKAVKASAAVGRAQAYKSKVQGLKGFGVKPLKMLMRDNGMTGNAPGKKAAMGSIGREQKYPARNLSAAGAFSASASGAQTLSGVEQTLQRSVRGGTMFATGKTLLTDKFPDGGSGVFFRIDADAVIANLVQKYPYALRQAAISAGDRIGRKMLDIVEPYVPKDTGLLYSSAETNVEQTAGGLAGMEGGEAYSSGEMYGVSISYNAPYAEMVYFDTSKLHGKAYNDEYGTAEKDERETARWIEKAFEAEKGALKGLLVDYASAITAALNANSMKIVSFTRGSGKAVNFVTARR